jgi:hypothetical protein
MGKNIDNVLIKTILGLKLPLEGRKMPRTLTREEVARIRDVVFDHMAEDDAHPDEVQHKYNTPEDPQGYWRIMAGWHGIKLEDDYVYFHTWEEFLAHRHCPTCKGERTRKRLKSHNVPQGHIVGTEYLIECPTCKTQITFFFYPNSVIAMEGGKDFPYWFCCNQCPHYDCVQAYNDKYDLGPIKCCRRCPNYSQCEERDKKRRAEANEPTWPELIA